MIAADGAEPTDPILVVDDDPDLRGSLQRGLTLHGFEVQTAADGAAAIALLREYRPAAVVLDLTMPGLDGLGFITAIRAFGDDVPICVLTARTEVSHRVAGLDAGADDYLCKPFELAELVARIRAMVRRTTRSTTAADVVVVADLRIERAQRRVSRAGTVIDLTRREFDLLDALARDSGRTVSRSTIRERVWGHPAPQGNSIDVFIAHLRRKLSPPGTPDVIHTIRGTGYALRHNIFTRSNV